MRPELLALGRALGGAQGPREGAGRVWEEKL